MAAANVITAPARPHVGPLSPTHALSNGRGDVPEVLSTLALAASRRREANGAACCAISHACSLHARAHVLPIQHACNRRLPNTQCCASHMALLKMKRSVNHVRNAQVGPLAEAGVEVFHAAANGLPSWFRCATVSEPWPSVRLSWWHYVHLLQSMPAGSSAPRPQDPPSSDCPEPC